MDGQMDAHAPTQSTHSLTHDTFLSLFVCLLAQTYKLGVHFRRAGGYDRRID